MGYRKRPSTSTWGYKKELLDLYGEYPDCPYCENTIHLSQMHVDHIVPVVSRGSNEKYNKIAVCSECNQKKYTSTLLEYLLLIKVNPERVYWKLKGLHKRIPKDLLEYLRFPE